MRPEGYLLDSAFLEAAVSRQHARSNLFKAVASIELVHGACLESFVNRGAAEHSQPAQAIGQKRPQPRGQQPIHQPTRSCSLKGRGMPPRTPPREGWPRRLGFGAMGEAPPPWQPMHVHVGLAPVAVELLLGGGVAGAIRGCQTRPATRTTRGRRPERRGRLEHGDGSDSGNGDSGDGDGGRQGEEHDGVLCSPAALGPCVFPLPPNRRVQACPVSHHPFG
jgi:hypothetical protein